jgi:hypothetical protein
MKRTTLSKLLQGENVMGRERAILKRARALVESGWTQGAAARNARGHAVPSASPAAKKFCAEGSINRARLDGHYSHFDYEAASGCLDAVNYRQYQQDTISFNDSKTTTKRMVLAAFDAAIELCK